MTHHVWHICRQCGYRGTFLPEKEDKIPCPKCHDAGRPEVDMIPQDIDWMMNINSNFEVK